MYCNLVIGFRNRCQGEAGVQKLYLNNITLIFIMSRYHLCYSHKPPKRNEMYVSNVINVYYVALNTGLQTRSSSNKPTRSITKVDVTVAQRAPLPHKFLLRTMTTVSSV